MTTERSTRRRIKVVELFAGSCTLSELAEHKLGMEVLSTDSHQYGKVKLVGDLLDDKVLRAIVKFAPDVLWASSPCTGFSIASCGTHFRIMDGERVPQTSEAAIGMALALRVFEVLRAIKKKHGHMPVWFMENPVGMLGKMKFMDQAPIRHTVTYCRYGHTSMKPTHIWTNCKGWTPRNPCRKGGWGKTTIDGVVWILDEQGNPCHLEARRGQKSGTQGLSNAHDRAKLPKQLCREILKAARDRVLERRK